MPFTQGAAFIRGRRLLIFWLSGAAFIQERRLFEEIRYITAKKSFIVGLMHDMMTFC